MTELDRVAPACRLPWPCLSLTLNYSFWLECDSRLLLPGENYSSFDACRCRYALSDQLTCHYFVLTTPRALFTVFQATAMLYYVQIHASKTFLADFAVAYVL